MNITRDNYEEYFLLYADGELNNSDKSAVESFVKNHPDLAEELDMLMESILATTDITMPNKHLLLKTAEWNEENLTGIQQQMLLLLDKELPAENAKDLEQVIAADPLLQKDWSLLQQSQLNTEVVEMPGKENLYRHERDRKPIPISWVKWMAAAAVIAGIGWYGLSFITGTKTNDGIKVAGSNEVKQTSKDSPAITASKEKETDNNTPNAVVITDLVKENQLPAVGQNTLTPEKAVVQNKKTSSLKQAEQKNELPVPLNPMIKNKAPELAVQENNAPSNNYIPVPVPTEIITAKATPATQPIVNGAIVANAIYNEDAIDEPEYVNIAGARIKKQKLRGIFRNVTRTVGRTFDKSNVAQADVASLNK